MLHKATYWLQELDQNRSRLADRMALPASQIVSVSGTWAALAGDPPLLEKSKWFFLILISFFVVTQAINLNFGASPRWIQENVNRLRKLIGREQGSQLGLIWVILVTSLIFWLAVNGVTTPVWKLWPLYIYPIVYFFAYSKHPNRHVAQTVVQVTLFIFLLFNSILSIGVGELSFLNVLQSGWIAFALLFVAYGIRREQIAAQRVINLQGLLFDLSRNTDPLKFETCQQISDKLVEIMGYSRVFLLLHRNDITTVVGRAGKDANKLKEWFEVPQNQGISNRAIRLRKSQLVLDVRNDKDFISGGDFKTGSELVVPIIGRQLLVPYGTINIEDEQTYAFEETDAKVIQVLADFIGVLAERHDRYEGNLEQCISESLACKNSEEVYRTIVKYAQELLGSSVSCCYPIVPETRFPLNEPIINNSTQPESGEPQSESKMSASIYQAAIELMSNWEPVFRVNLAHDSVFLAISHDLVSMAFIPLGFESYRLAGLFLFFSTRQSFTAEQQRRLIRFAQAVTPALERLKRIRSFYEGFSGPYVSIHRLLSESEIGRGTWSQVLKTVLEIPQIENSEISEQINDLIQGFEYFLRVARITDPASMPFLENQNLRYMINHFKSELEQTISRSQIVFEPDDEIDRENKDLRWVIFCIAVEATINAFLHGNATYIHIKVNHNQKNITLSVEDNGQGFDPQYAAQHAGFAGIFDLDIRAQTLLGASPIDWLDTAPNGKGARMVWKVPVLQMGPKVGSED